MKTSSKSIAPIRRGLRGTQVLVGGVLLSLGLCSAAFADPGQIDAKLAIARAQASVDLVSKETPAATHDVSFATAQQKLTDAQTAISHDHNRQAEWLANESELLADTTAGSAKLADLERTRNLAAHDLDVLRGEMNNSNQNK